MEGQVALRDAQGVLPNCYREAKAFSPTHSLRNGLVLLSPYHQEVIRLSKYPKATVNALPATNHRGLTIRDVRWLLNMLKAARIRVLG